MKRLRRLYPSPVYAKVYPSLSREKATFVRLKAKRKEVKKNVQPHLSMILARLVARSETGCYQVLRVTPPAAVCKFSPASAPSSRRINGNQES